MNPEYRTPLGKVSIIPKGLYNAAVAYEPLDIIRYNGNGYIVKKACTGITPTDGEYYMMLTGFSEEELANQ